MKSNKYLILSIVMLCLLTVVHVEAKDLIFTQGYGAVEVIDTDTDEIVAHIPVKGFVREIVHTADKKHIYCTTNRNSIVKIDLQQMKVVNTFDAGRDGWKRNIWGLVLDNDNQTGYINSIDRKVDGGEVLVRPTISQIDLKDGKVLRSMTAPWGVAGLVYMKDGKTLHALAQDIHKIDLTQKELNIVAVHPMFDRGINILPIWHSTQENGGIFMANYYTPEFMGLLIINTHTGVIEEHPIKGPPALAYSFTYSADKKLAYGIMEDVTVIDMTTNSIVKTFPNLEGTSYSAIPTMDGKKLYVGAGGSTIMVYDIATLSVSKVLQLQADCVALNRINF